MSADAAVAILQETVIDPHVIVLEDDPELRSLLTRGLREEGFEVTTAGTASEMLGSAAGRGAGRDDRRHRPTRRGRP